MISMKKLKGAVKRPSKDTVLKALGWYSTRVLAVALWSGVIWALLGDQALPVKDKEARGSSCVPEYKDLDNDSFTDLLDYLKIPPNADGGLFNNYSFVYSCNVSGYQYCLTTIQFNSDCATKLSLNVTLLDNLTFTATNENSSIKNFTVDFDLADAIETAIEDGPSNPQTLFDIPDGHFFALIVLIILSGIGGKIARLLKLPPLLGMMVAGFLLRNIPVVGIAGDISPIWSSTLRNVALVIILTRGGLVLDAKQLWKLKIAVPLLALLPCITEGLVDGVVAIFLLDLPWGWGLMLG